MAALIIIGLAGASVLRRIHSYDALIVRIAREYGVDPRLISAVAWKESRFDPGCTGKAGEIGLMQVREIAAKEWAEAQELEHFSKHELYNPETNIRAGTWYLARAISAWSIRRDPLPYALAEYNSGRSNVLRWADGDDDDARIFWGQITYPTTKRYVRDILKKYRGHL
ncbi:MAG: lytic transglycosylase domain-containing protein [Verrucomicrobia bacterium]|nr:lytic transglycosylase domain-containing protein [Verrucomicrobiota bacterium]